METQRIPLASALAPRNSSLDKDGLLVNCYKENTPLGEMVVKRPGLLNTWNAGLGCAQGMITFDGQALIVVAGYYGVAEQAPTVYSDGTSWSAYVAMPNPSAGASFAANRIGYLVSLNDTLFAIGGGPTSAGTSDVYSSNGIGGTWTYITTLTGGVLARPNCAVLGSTILAIIGASVKGSTDGANWSTYSAAPFSIGQGLITHSNGKIYAFSSTAVSSSVDGVTWVSVTSSPGWTGRLDFSIWSIGGNLYLGGGRDGGGAFYNDVWKSVDNGANWTQVTAAAAFAIRAGAPCWSYNSKLWIGAGYEAVGAVTYYTDLYSSSDGITWALVAANFIGTATRLNACCLHAGTMYVGSGFSSAAVVVAITRGADGAEEPAQGEVVLTALSPAPTTACQPFTFTLIPASGATPVKVFFKDSEQAWLWDGTTLTGISDSNYPDETVPGCVYLDGTVYVMDSQGIIYGSDLLDPTSWSALNFISANSEADAAVALARQLNYVVAFKQTSTEFFYDAANAVGSPLGKVLNALLEIGCASAGSLATADNTIYFMANSRQKGRSVMKLEGYTPKLISTPYIDRILNADSLEEIYAFVVKSNGHFFYVLTLVDTELTLVYDETSAEWHTWTTMTAESPTTIASATVQDSGAILVAMLSPHGLADGDPVVIAGATPSAVNGAYNIRYDSATMSAMQFSYTPSSTVTGTITGVITAVFYSETFFPGVYYSYGDGVDYLLDRTTGDVWTFAPTIYEDNDCPIDVSIRTALVDLGTMASKRFNRFELVGDLEDTNILVRHSDDDYDSYSLFRTIAVARNRAMISNLGSGRRRAFDLRNTGNVPLRLLAAEIDTDIGAF